MAYKIAVASSNGIDLDVHFGAAERFYIYEVNEGQYHLTEIRKYEAAAESGNEGNSLTPSDHAADRIGVPESGTGSNSSAAGDCAADRIGVPKSGTGSNSPTPESCAVRQACAPGSGCGSGGCGGAGGRHPKVELVADCRCVVCRRIGFNIQKQLEKLAITSFDVDCSIEEALHKITAYLQKVDSHQSLRGSAKTK